MKDPEKLLNENEVAFPPAPPERLEAGLDDILCRALFSRSRSRSGYLHGDSAGIVL